MKSIIPRGDEPRCYLCGNTQNLEVHHCIHGTAGRKFATTFGLTVNLCPMCHKFGYNAVHRNSKVDKSLQRIAQMSFEKKYGHELWMERWGKNYI